MNLFSEWQKRQKRYLLEIKSKPKAITTIQNICGTSTGIMMIDIFINTQSTTIITATNFRIERVLLLMLFLFIDKGKDNNYPSLTHSS